MVIFINDKIAMEVENVNTAEEANGNIDPVQHKTDGSELTDHDCFSYLQRKEFTSEVYKVEVRNLGYFGIGEFKKLIKTKLQLNMSKIKTPNKKDFAFVCFRSREDQLRAIETLNGYTWKGKKLQAFAAKASADPLMKRRHDQQTNLTEGDASEPKKLRTAAEATCPLASLPYEDQLKQKGAEMEKLLKNFSNELGHINADSKKYLKDFKLSGIEASPVVNGYRNKNEFTVGKNSVGETVVGFRLGSYADGSVEVSELENLPHLPDAAKWAAKSFQTFVRASNFLPFNPESNSGHFRQVMVRTSMHTGEIMIVAGIYSSNLNEVDLVELKSELKQFYENYESTDYKCSSLYYQDVKRREAGQTVSPVEHLLGNTYITDSIRGLIFRISPLAFFQINTKGADVLYLKAIDLAEPQPHSTVLDICCGTGTIALSFAKYCKQVLGVEIIPEAIKDAEVNAELNKINNCKFFAGNADNYIQSMVREAVYGKAPNSPFDLLAIVDPPRAGLHTRSICSIRASSAINRLVYISCNPTRAQKNWIELGRPESKQYKGRPFFPKTALAVDMFPHTSHVEMIVLFERERESEQDTNDKNDECVEKVTTDEPLNDQ